MIPTDIVQPHIHVITRDDEIKMMHQTLNLPGSQIEEVSFTCFSLPDIASGTTGNSLINLYACKTQEHISLDYRQVIECRQQKEDVP
jgi:hypothetical protein